jgi:SET domain
MKVLRAVLSLSHRQSLLLLHQQQPQAAAVAAAASVAPIAVQQLQQTKLGVALYMRASVLNHSCAPTAAVRFEGRTIVVAATEPIAKGDPIEVGHFHCHNTNCCSMRVY